MQGRLPEIRLASAAKVAGLAYLLIIGLAAFANFAVVGLIEDDDAVATAANVADSEGLLRAGLASFLIVFVLDVVVAWSLWIFFRPVSAGLSLLTAWLRLVYTVLLGAGLIGLFLALLLAGDSDWVTALEANQRDSQVMLTLELWQYGFLTGLFCFGAHLAMLGYLALRSGVVPRIIGTFLMVAGGAYLLDTLANALLAGYSDVEAVFLVIVAVPALIGELGFALWLLLRGTKLRDGAPGAATQEA
jgi:hypothetical protein